MEEFLFLKISVSITGFFDDAFNGTPATSFFCLIVSVVFFLSVIYLLLRAARAGGFKSGNLLKKLSAANISPDHELIKVINQKEKWPILSIFLRSLIEKQDGEARSYFYRTQSASLVINPENVNPTLFKNYLLTWLPSVLTTLGVLGTFVGLRLGIDGINAEGKVDEMMSGINNLLDGSKTAFTTSIFGVTAGIVFGLFLRWIRQIQRSRIHKIARVIDELIPECQPEREISELRDFTQQTTEHLKALREEVGPKLQETLRSMPADIGHAVTNGIQSAVGQMGEKNAQEFGTALQDLYSEHLGDLSGLGDTIRSQSELTKTILEKLGVVPSALEATANHLDSSSKSLALVSDNFGTWNDALGTFTSTLSDSTDSFSIASSTLSDAATALEDAVPSLQEAVGNATEVSTSSNVAISENSKNLLESFGQVSGSFDGFGDAVQALESLAPSLNSTSVKLNEMIVGLDTTIETQSSNASKNLEAAERFEEISGHFENAANHLGTLGEVSENLVKAGDTAEVGFEKLGEVTNQLSELGGSLTTIAESFELVRNEEIGANFAVAATALNDASEQLGNLSTASQNLEEAGNKAVQLFKESGSEHTVFIEGLTSGVAALKEEIASLLETYRDSMAEQTRERISDWNKQATNFGIDFTHKVNDLSGSIEDLQESLGNLNS